MIPYRIRYRLQKFIAFLFWTAIVCAVLALCWLLWLNRYVVYTRNGVRLDFDLPGNYPAGNIAVKPIPDTTVNIYYDDGTVIPDGDPAELKQLAGVYVTETMLAENFDAVAAQLKALPAGSTIMLDVKSVHGKYYYNTELGPVSTGIPAQQMSDLIAQLNRSGHYIIARLPALRDYYYAIDNVNNGIFLASKKGLWLDGQRTYWLNPTKEGTITYLREIIMELRLIGFDEVVLSDFSIPDTDEIFFDGNKKEAIRQAANVLTALTTDTFALSFMASKPDFPLPEGRCRLYFTDVPAASAAATAAATGIEDTDKRIVFLTDRMDTRFDAYGVLRPLDLDN